MSDNQRRDEQRWDERWGEGWDEPVGGRSHPSAPERAAPERGRRQPPPPAPERGREQPPPRRPEHPPHRPEQLPPRPEQPAPQRSTIPTVVVGFIAGAFLLGLALGGGGVYFLVPDRSGSQAPAAAQPGAQLNDQLNDAIQDAATGAANAPAPGGAAAEPKTEEAIRVAASQVFDRYAAADYGGSWDRWYAEAKRTFPREEYVQFFELCPQVAEGIRFTIDEITHTPGADEALVRASRLIGTFTWQFIYQDGGWRFIPEDKDMNAYRTHQTAEALAEFHRSEGGCTGA